jgi:hypothetical protein
MFVDRSPPSEVAARITVSLGIGLIVGIEGSGRTKTSEFEPSHSRLCSEQWLLYSRHR